MIESMVAASARNIRALIDGRAPADEATWNAVCLADFGDSGVGFVAIPQIPPAQYQLVIQGQAHSPGKKSPLKSIFCIKCVQGVSEPVYEKYIMQMLGIDKLKKPAT